jgi:hypothetical protein
MGIFSGISQGVVSASLCGHFKRHAGPDCADLRSAICQNVDLYQLWVDNARAEGIRGPREVRSWARMFPKVQKLMTPKNVKRWLREQGLSNIARTVETTEGGEQWLEWQLDRFRVGLWGNEAITKRPRPAEEPIDPLRPSSKRAQ